jgi:enolase
MSAIIDLRAREILDSRGNPTIEVDLYLESGAIGRASVPSGASCGTAEAKELRDNQKNRYAGKGVQNAIDQLHGEVFQAISGYESQDQMGLDRLLCTLDATKTKERLGANALLGVSLAASKASASEFGLPLYQYLGGIRARILPVPFMNILNGGKHANNNVDIQEFMIVPHGASSFKEALRMGTEVFHALRQYLDQNGLDTNVGDEGGFAPKLKENKQALDFLMEAITKAGYRPKEEISIALDVASNEFYQNGAYRLKNDGQNKDKTLFAPELIEIYEQYCTQYPIISIEDGLAEDDWRGWQEFTQKLGSKIQLVGDDLFVTNVERITKGITQHVANSVLIKLNQIGTLSETMEAVELAHNHNYRTIISHRSGETEDSFIADLAIATQSGQIKTGAPCRSERLAKYNQLLRIEEELGPNAIYAGYKG